MFEVFFTNSAKNQYYELKNNINLKKTLEFLSIDPRYNSLKTHEFTSLKGPNGEKIFEAYAQQATPSAYRVFWCYGPKKNQIKIIAITLYP